jgi:hypothetical protein
VPHEILLRGFARTPVGRNRRKLPDDQRLDVRARRFLVIQIRTDISDVRIGQADDLADVARIGENFLIPGEAGIENDFAAAPGIRARAAAVKNAPIFERKNSLPCFRFGQWTFSWPALAKALRRKNRPNAPAYTDLLHTTTQSRDFA